MKGFFAYWRLHLIILAWFCGWGMACLSVIHAIKAFDVEVNIQFFLRSMVIQFFLPALFLAAVFLGAGLLFWHPTWNAVKPVRRKARQLVTTNITTK